MTIYRKAVMEKNHDGCVTRTLRTCPGQSRKARLPVSDDSTKKKRRITSKRKKNDYWEQRLNKLSFLPPKTSCHSCEVFHHSAGDTFRASQTTVRPRRRAPSLCEMNENTATGTHRSEKPFFFSRNEIVRAHARWWHVHLLLWTLWMDYRFTTAGNHQRPYHSEMCILTFIFLKTN